MSERVQEFLLKNTKGLQRLINDKLAKRPGKIGGLFSFFEIGVRQYSRHTLPSFLKLTNYLWVVTFHNLAVVKPIFSRFIGVTNGPLNYSGMALYFLVTAAILSRFRMNRVRDLTTFNGYFTLRQDNPEFWYSRYNMIFPANFLHFRLSAHFIEINHIFAVEMTKKYFHIRKSILQEREQCSDEEKRTRYITNPNYVYEKLGQDHGSMSQFKADNLF